MYYVGIFFGHRQTRKAILECSQISQKWLRLPRKTLLSIYIEMKSFSGLLSHPREILVGVFSRPTPHYFRISYVITHNIYSQAYLNLCPDTVQPHTHTALRQYVRYTPLRSSTKDLHTTLLCPLFQLEENIRLHNPILILKVDFKNISPGLQLMKFNEKRWLTFYETLWSSKKYTCFILRNSHVYLIIVSWKFLYMSRNMIIT